MPPRNPKMTTSSTSCWIRAWDRLEKKGLSECVLHGLSVRVNAKSALPDELK